MGKQIPKWETKQPLQPVLLVLLFIDTTYPHKLGINKFGSNLTLQSQTKKAIDPKPYVPNIYRENNTWYYPDLAKSHNN